METVVIVKELDNKTVGIYRENDGTYLAMTYSVSKNFKTLKGAVRWLSKMGYDASSEGVMREFAREVEENCAKENEEMKQKMIASDPRYKDHWSEENFENCENCGRSIRRHTFCWFCGSSN